MASITQPRARAWVALVTVWILWGSTYLGIRVAVQTIPPLLMCGVRFLLAGCVLALAIWLTQRKRLAPLRPADLKAVVMMGVLLLVVGTGTLSWAEVRMPSGIAALIVAGVPIWMLLIDALFERRLKPVALAGIAVGTIGMVALVGMPSGHVPLLVALALMASSTSWAFGSVLARRHHADRTHPLFPALEMIVAGLVLCGVAALTGETRGFTLAHVTAASTAGFFWLVFMGSMVAYSAYGYAVRALPTNVVSTYAYVNPIVAVVLGAVILREAITLNVLLGGATIITAVVIILVANSRRKEAALELDDAA